MYVPVAFIKWHLPALTTMSVANMLVPFIVCMGTVKIVKVVTTVPVTKAGLENDAQ